MKRLWRAFVALVMCREIDPGIQRHTVSYPIYREAISEYAAEEQRILADDDGPFQWPEHDVIQPEYCGCRLCHDHGIGQLTKDAIETAFQGMLDVPDTRQFAERAKRTRGRKWTP